MARQPATDETAETSTLDVQDGFDPEAIAARPEVQAAFDRAFSESDLTDEETGEAAPASTPRERRKQEEAQEELQLSTTQEVADPKEPVATVAPAAPAPKDTGKDAPTGPTLNPILRQAAKRSGWEDDAIDEFWTANAQFAEKTFHRMHDAQNELTAQYAQIGRQRMQGGEQPPARGEAPARQPAQGKPKSFIEGLYGSERLEAARERYGDSFIPDVLEPLVAPLQEMYQHFEDQRAQALGNQVESFFSGLPQEFESMYGKQGSRNKAHIEVMKQVGTMADEIMAGATLRGVEMPIGEALSRAHAYYAGDFIETLARKRVTQQVKTRNRQITQQPTQRRAAGGVVEGRKNLQSAMAAYAEKAAELNYDVGGE